MCQDFDECAMQENKVVVAVCGVPLSELKKQAAPGAKSQHPSAKSRGNRQLTKQPVNPVPPSKHQSKLRKRKPLEHHIQEDPTHEPPMHVPTDNLLPKTKTAKIQASEQPTQQQQREPSQQQPGAQNPRTPCGPVHAQECMPLLTEGNCVHEQQATMSPPAMPLYGAHCLEVGDAPHTAAVRAAVHNDTQPAEAIGGGAPEATVPEAISPLFQVWHAQSPFTLLII